MSTPSRLAALATVALLTVSGAGCARDAWWRGEDDVTVRIAIVANSQMQDAVELSEEFEAANPGIALDFQTLSENEARAKITASVSTGSDDYDLVMIGNYETAQWAANGWLVNLSELIDDTPDYDEDDLIPSVRRSLSHDDDLYAVPFYGESSFLMYRKDLFEQAGLTMPERPTWDEVAEFARILDDNPPGTAGICLRGKAGWGELLAPLDTVINTFGGRWFDTDWTPELTSPDVTSAVEFYVGLVRSHGQPGAAASGFRECAADFAAGDSAMWYDATSAVSVIEDPSVSKVVGKVGYAYAPVVVKPDSGWLYTWALGIPVTSKVQDAAWKFASWMTSRAYVRLVGQRLGWERVPPGSRNSTYEIPEYQAVSAAYGPLTLSSMERADPERPTLKPVPYTGIQFIAIPEFQDLGTTVSEQFSAAIAGRIGVGTALVQAQYFAGMVGELYRARR